ncbi:hypothetical protein B0H66DRAFT_635334 [Apodospora peruviana]|uniref:Uncharacterized protein n=1 Tax=Apodospora peruviana TaxID=516989 RepID=A0AAE0MGM0_9PEZI|nr:hypothetical protein B0H66DRAFT_635334 [Apodospora peruviana]
MAPKVAGETAAGREKKKTENPAQAGPAPPTGRTLPIRVADDDDEEMEADDNSDNDEDSDDFAGGPNPLSDESDEMLAGMIMEFAPNKKQAIAYAVADAFITRLQKPRQQVEIEKERDKNSNNWVDLAALQKIVSEAVAKAVEEKVTKAIEEVRKEVQEARSWVAVATVEPELPTKRIPGRLNKEILVRGSAEPALTRRSPQEIVQAVNGVSKKKGAIAARKLPSGDVIVTFQDIETKNWHSENGGWIGTAFGESAKEAKRTFAVLMKGMLKRELNDITEANFGKQLGLTSVDKVKFRIPTMAGVTRATVLVTLTSQEEAKKACDDGVVWRAQILDCEPGGRIPGGHEKTAPGQTPAFDVAQKQAARSLTQGKLTFEMRDRTVQATVTEATADGTLAPASDRDVGMQGA